MYTSQTNNRPFSSASTAALAIAFLAGTAAAQTQSGPIYVLEPPTLSGANPRVHAVANNAAGVVLTTETSPDAAFGYNKIIWTWEDGGLASPDDWSIANQTNPSGGYYAYELKNVMVTSVGRGSRDGGVSRTFVFDTVAHTAGPIPGSSIFSSAGSAPVHISPEHGSYTGATSFGSMQSGARRVFGATAADIDGDGMLDLAACSWSVDAGGASAPTLLQMDPSSSFSRTRGASTYGDIQVGVRGRIDRSASIDYSPEEDSLRAALWIDGLLTDVSNIDSYRNSTFSDVCDDGSTALLHVTEQDGSQRVLAYSTLTHQGRLLDASGMASFHALSSDGSTIVGSAADASGLTRAAFWTRAADGEYTLNDFATYIDNLGHSGLDGVSFIDLTAVSADGLTVAGTLALADGSIRAFTAAVPTPGSVFLLAAAGTIAARRRRG